MRHTSSCKEHDQTRAGANQKQDIGQGVHEDAGVDFLSQGIGPYIFVFITTSDLTVGYCGMCRFVAIRIFSYSIRGADRDIGEGCSFVITQFKLDGVSTVIIFCSIVATACIFIIVDDLNISIEHSAQE